MPQARADEYGEDTEVELFVEVIKGTLKNRPELDRLTAAIDQLDVVVAYSLDRLGRSAKHMLELWERLDEAGVTLVFVREKIDTSTPVGRLLRTVLFALAEFERDLIAERTAVGLEGRARRGEVAAGTPRYGYRWGDDKKHVVVPEEAEVVRAIFEDFISGVSQREIARKLNDQNIPTRSGGTWRQSAISKILRSPAYIGKVEYKGETYDGHHEAIVDEDTWNKAQPLKTGGGRKGGRIPDRGHLLGKGLLRCTCGSAMIPRKARDVYECSGRIEHGTDFCSQGPIKRVELDEPFVRQVLDRHIDLEATQKRLAERAAGALELAVETEAKRDRKVAIVEAALAKTERDYDEGIIDGRQYAKRETRLTADLETAIRDRDETRSHVERLKQAGPVGDAEKALLERLAALKKAITAGIGSAPDMPALRNVIGDVFEGVYLGRMDGGRIVWPQRGNTKAADGFHPFDEGDAVVPTPALNEGETRYWLMPVLKWAAVDRELWEPVPVELSFSEPINKVTG